jgi:MFS family permease
VVDRDDVRRFRLYLGAYLAFDLAAQVQSVAIAWQVYSVRHSAFDLGLVGLVLFTPSLVLAPVTGLVADRFDRRRVVAATSVVQIAVCAALVPLAGRHGAGALGVILAVLAVAGTARAFRYPAAASLLPAIVPPHEYVRANAAASAVREVVLVGGPAAGGVLVAIGSLAAYGTAIGAFALGAAMVVSIPMVRRAPADAGVSWREVFAGLQFLRAKPVLSGAITLDLFAVLFGGATALLPIYAAQIFHVGPAGFGALRASVALGTALCALVLARRPIRRYAGPRLLAAVACFGAATIAFGLSTSLWVAIPALAVAGAADMVSMAIRDALIALGTPDAMRGRVTAVEGVFIVASNELGEFESGTLAAFIGAVPTVVLGGVLTLAVVAAWAWRNPALRRADAIVT